MDDNKNINESTKNRVGLKVTGIILGIIAGIVIISYIFSKTILPMMMYNNAVNQANQGNYVNAYNILTNNEKIYNYKDAAAKCCEYALRIGEKYLDDGDIENAYDHFLRAYNEEKNKEAYQKSIEHFFEIGEMLFKEGDIKNAKDCFDKALYSENEEIKAKASAYLKTLELE